MSEIIYQTNATDFLGTELVNEIQEKLNVKLRKKNSLILSKNSKARKKYRWRLKIDRNSELFPDSVRDLHYLTGLIDTLEIAKSHNHKITIEQLLKEIKDNEYQFHHATGDTLNIDTKMLLVSDWQHIRLDNLLWKSGGN